MFYFCLANILLPPSCFETTSSGVVGGATSDDVPNAGVLDSTDISNQWKSVMKSVDEIVLNLHNYKQLRYVTEFAVLIKNICERIYYI